MRELEELLTRIRESYPPDKFPGMAYQYSHHRQETFTNKQYCINKGYHC